MLESRLRCQARSKLPFRLYTTSPARSNFGFRLYAGGATAYGSCTLIRCIEVCDNTGKVMLPSVRPLAMRTLKTLGLILRFSKDKAEISFSAFYFKVWTSA